MLILTWLGARKVCLSDITCLSQPILFSVDSVVHSPALSSLLSKVSMSRGEEEEEKSLHDAHISLALSFFPRDKHVSSLRGRIGQK